VFQEEKIERTVGPVGPVMLVPGTGCEGEEERAGPRGRGPGEKKGLAD